MLSKYEERVLIEVLEDKELDVFGIYKRKKEEQEKSQKHKLLIIEKERQKQKEIKFCEIISKRLVELYGTEGAIPYLRILLNPVEEKVI